MREIFEKIYNETNAELWKGSESKSGVGSSLYATWKLRGELEILFEKYGIKSVLDVPCGDFNWMKKVDLTGISYIGGDIVPALIENNKKKFPDVDFRVIDLSSDDLPDSDLLIARDVLVHFSNQDIFDTISNIKKSNIKWLLTTTFFKHRRWKNEEIETGQWRTLNLTEIPFNFIPEYIINEDCVEGDGAFSDKSMALFDVSKLPD